MKKQKENSREGITWSEMGKQNVQAEKVYCCRFESYLSSSERKALILSVNDSFSLSCILIGVVYHTPDATTSQALEKCIINL